MIVLGPPAVRRLALRKGGACRTGIAVTQSANHGPMAKPEALGRCRSQKKKLQCKSRTTLLLRAFTYSKDRQDGLT